MDLDNTPTYNNREDRVKMSDMVSIMKLPERKWVRVRLLPGVFSDAVYWVKTLKKDGGSTKFPAICPSYDAETCQRDSTIYDPWEPHSKRNEKGEAIAEYSQSFFMNLINRSLQKKFRAGKPTKAEAKSGFKDMESETETPVQVLSLGKSLLGKIKDLKELNTRERNGEIVAYSVNDKKFGRDIMIRYDSSKPPADRYQVMLADTKSKLTEEELEYLIWDIQSAIPNRPDEATVRADYNNWAKRNGVNDGDDEDKPRKKKKQEDFDDDDEDEAPKKKRKAPVDDFDDEDEDDEPAPKKSKGKKSKVVDDDDFDDDDEDDEPVAKKGKGKKQVDDFDDEDDEEDEPPPRKSKKAKVEDDFDDEDDDDEPPKKSKKRKQDDFDDDEDEDEDEPVSKTKKRKPVDDFDDEDEDAPPKKSKGKKKPVDDFDDEDEDDEPAPKKSKGKKSKVVDDFDDEDDDF